MTAAVTSTPAAVDGGPLAPLIDFAITDLAIDTLREKYLHLEVRDIDDKAGFEQVHEARMDMRGRRTAVEKRRKELKADVIKAEKAIDGEARRLTSLLTPIEERLEREETRYKKWLQDRKEAAERAELAKVNARLDQLAAVGAMRHPSVVAILTDEEFADTLATCTREFEERQAAEAAAAEELRREEARLAEERAKLERERQEQEAQLAEQRRLDEAKLAAERAEIERQKAAAAAEQAKLDAEKQRLADETAERERQEEIKRREAEAVERSNREAEERQQREAKAAAEKAEAERLAKEKAERLRPDREKLRSVAEAVESIALPKVTEREAICAATLIYELLQSTAAKIREAADLVGQRSGE